MNHRKSHRIQLPDKGNSFRFTLINSGRSAAAFLQDKMQDQVPYHSLVNITGWLLKSFRSSKKVVQQRLGKGLDAKQMGMI